MSMCSFAVKLFPGFAQVGNHSRDTGKLGVGPIVPCAVRPLDYESLVSQGRLHALLDPRRNRSVANPPKP